MSAGPHRAQLHTPSTSLMMGSLLRSNLTTKKPSSGALAGSASYPLPRVSPPPVWCADRTPIERRGCSGGEKKEQRTTRVLRIRATRLFHGRKPVANQLVFPLKSAGFGGQRGTPALLVRNEAREAGAEGRGVCFDGGAVFLRAAAARHRPAVLPGVPAPISPPQPSAVRDSDSSLLRTKQGARAEGLL